MAKLEGVTVVDMKDGEVTKISYEGEEYAKVDEEAKEGDIGLRVKHNVPGIASVGSYYRLKGNRGVYSLLYYISEKGIALNTSDESNFTVFRKISAPSHEDRISDLETRVDTLEKGEAKTKPKTVNRAYEVIVEDKPADPREQFENGDKVRLISGGGRWPLNDYYDGHIYEV